MFSTDLIFRQQENLVDNQKCQAGFRPLCNKKPFFILLLKNWSAKKEERIRSISALEASIKNPFIMYVLQFL